MSEYHGMLVKEIAYVPADTSSFQPLVFETNPADNLVEFDIRGNLIEGNLLEKRFLS